MGGGGYDVRAVARCWALAYGVMVDRELPQDIPAQYLDAYPSGKLRDGDMPLAVAEDQRAQARAFAEDSVEAVKGLVFPVHRIS